MILFCSPLPLRASSIPIRRWPETARSWYRFCGPRPGCFTRWAQCLALAQQLSGRPKAHFCRSAATSTPYRETRACSGRCFKWGQLSSGTRVVCRSAHWFSSSPSTACFSATYLCTSNFKGKPISMRQRGRWCFPSWLASAYLASSSSPRSGLWTTFASLTAPTTKSTMNWKIRHRTASKSPSRTPSTCSSPRKCFSSAWLSSTQVNNRYAKWWN